MFRQRIIDEVNGLTLLDMRCAICKGEPYFVLQEMGDTLKYKLDHLVVVTCKINNNGFV